MGTINERILKVRINWSEGDPRREALYTNKEYHDYQHFNIAMHGLTNDAPPRDGSFGYRKISVTLTLLAENFTKREVTPHRLECYKGDGSPWGPEDWING